MFDPSQNYDILDEDLRNITKFLVTGTFPQNYHDMRVRAKLYSYHVRLPVVLRSLLVDCTLEKDDRQFCTMFYVVCDYIKREVTKSQH